jgi:hypothetical protein
LAAFMPWAVERFDGDALEGATVLRMAASTARARAHITDTIPWPLAQFPERQGSCHAYSEPEFATAVHRLGVVRDFSAAVDAPPLPERR